MFFDSHAHYDDERFDADRETLLASFEENGIDNVVNIGTNLETAQKCLELCEKYDFIYCALGFYPEDVGTISEDDILRLETLCKSRKKVVAIGEIGLDYHQNETPREVQKLWFERQLRLAEKLDLPVAIHMRESTADTLEILKKSSVKTGVLHCFSGSCETAEIALKMGFYISFSGTVTFKNAKNVAEAAKIVPDDRILIETDCPYLSPEPNRGKRNSSLNLKYTAQKIAELRGTTLEHIAKISSKNAKTMYGIK